MRLRDLTGLVRNRGPALVLADPASRRSLAAVIAILTFLAALATLGAEIVASRSGEWTSSLGREATVQLRPQTGRDIEADLARAAALARGVAGIDAATIVSRREAEDLLEPWLGRGLDSSTLPIPRLVVLKLGSGAAPDFQALRTRIAAEIQGATVDDHGVWLSRLAGAGQAIVGAATGIVALVLAATGLAVAYATRGAMAGSRDVVDVLHLVGADDRFLAAEFASSFLRLGLAAAALGGALAAATVAALAHGVAGDTLIDLLEAGPMGYGFVLVVVIAVAAITGFVSAWTVKRYLRQLQAR